MGSGDGPAKDRTRVSGARQKSADRPFRYRPNPARQAMFAVIALVGVGVGYGVGYLTSGKSSPPPQPQQPAAVADRSLPAAAAPAATPAPLIAPPLLPESVKPVEGSKVRAYEEALPKNIVEAHAPATPPAAAPAAPPVAAAPPSPQPLAALPSRPEKPEAKPETTAPPAAATGRLPAWRRFAVAVPAAAGRPRIAIVIDDLGIDKARTARAINLHGPLTMSFLTYASGLKAQTAAAKAAGHELMMHIPMEPGSASIDPGPNVLLTGIPHDELLASLRWNLDQFDGYVGVNNHMGSRFTADLTGMLVVMEEMKKRDLLFLDSITATSSVAGKAAHQVGVPFARRNIFLDHDDNVTSIKRQLAEVEKLAKRTGVAVAIGHPREATLQALVPWLSGIEERGFQLVPVSAVVRPPASRG